MATLADNLVDGHRTLPVLADLAEGFEACVLVDGETFARTIEREVLAVDRVYSRRITADDLRGTLEALRMRVRHPVTLAMLNARVL